MKEIIVKIHDKWRDYKEKCRHRLDELPSVAKLNIILLMMAFYLVVTVVVFIGIINERSNDAIKVRHIEPVELMDAPVKMNTTEDNDTVYSYQLESNTLVNK